MNDVANFVTSRPPVACFISLQEAESRYSTHLNILIYISTYQHASITEIRFTAIYFEYILQQKRVFTKLFHKSFGYKQKCVCEVSAVGKISDCQPGGPGFNPRPGRGLNFGRPSFATPSVDRDVKPLV